MTSKPAQELAQNLNQAPARRAAPRSVPVLSRTPAGRRSFVLRLVRDRAVREAQASANSTKS
jgi:hypothetical protein